MFSLQMKSRALIPVGLVIQAKGVAIRRRRFELFLKPKGKILSHRIQTTSALIDRFLPMSIALFLG
ncbi:MAG: hypothetical protein AMK71_05290 [Nitrospira bacterium SG8_35_4]|nr:MAG: hypothetical protein AMK71_05290 [Nitrospira bacterium SG8_35_4]